MRLKHVIMCILTVTNLSKMTLEQIKAVYSALVNDGRARAASAVAKETGVPKADVERFVAFIKTSPLFRFELTKTGLLRKLVIATRVPGTYTQFYTQYGKYEFYKGDHRIATFADDYYNAVLRFHEKFEAEAVAANVPCYVPHSPRIDALGPFLVKWLEA